MQVGVLASGSGTILRAILDRNLPVAVVIAAGSDFEQSDFGKAATAVARSAECPVFVVRTVTAPAGVSTMRPAT